LFNTTNIDYHIITLEPIIKHLGANDINRVCFINDEWKIMETLNSFMDEWNHAPLGLLMDE
jgi:hypothetical protein